MQLYKNKSALKAAHYSACSSLNVPRRYYAVSCIIALYGTIHVSVFTVVCKLMFIHVWYMYLFSFVVGTFPLSDSVCPLNLKKWRLRNFTETFKTSKRKCAKSIRIFPTSVMTYFFEKNDTCHYTKVLVANFLLVYKSMDMTVLRTCFK